MVAVRMTGELTPCFFATPSYLAASGRPKRPRDLLRHKCVRYKFITANRVQDWQLIEDGQTKTVEPPTRLVFDSMEAVRQAVRDGQGIGWCLKAMIEDELEAGSLQTVLDRYVPNLPPYYLYYPEQNRRLELLRLFVEFLISKRQNPCLRTGKGPVPDT